MTEAITRLVAEFKMPPSEINEGLCADFADAIWRQVPGAEVWADDELGAEEYRHTFLKFNGLYFDSECPNGVLDWRQLPIYTRQ